MAKQKTISTRIDADTHKKARKMAVDADKPLSEILRQLLFGWMKKQEAQQADPPAKE